MWIQNMTITTDLKQQTTHRLLVFIVIIIIVYYLLFVCFSMHVKFTFCQPYCLLLAFFVLLTYLNKQIKCGIKKYLFRCFFGGATILCEFVSIWFRSINSIVVFFCCKSFLVISFSFHFFLFSARDCRLIQNLK